MYNLPVNDVLKDGEEEIGADTQAVNFDQARMYDARMPMPVLSLRWNSHVNSLPEFLTLYFLGRPF